MIMEPRAADSRPSRLSLIEVFRDAPAAANEGAARPVGLRSVMEWDDEDKAAAPSPVTKSKTTTVWQRLAGKASGKSLRSTKSSKDLLAAPPTAPLPTPPPVPPTPAQKPLAQTPRGMALRHLGSSRDLQAPSTTSLASSALLRQGRSFTSAPGGASSPVSPAEDPFSKENVARVKRQLREEQDKEVRERRARTKAEMRAVQAAAEPQRKYRWGKVAIDKLADRSSRFGWQMKDDPNNYDDETWKWIMNALNHEDGAPLRDRLFEKLEKTGIHSSAVQKFVENQQPHEPPPPPIGLGIREEPPSASSAFSNITRRTTGRTPEEDLYEERQRQLRAMPSLPESLGLSDTSSTRRRRSLERLTEGLKNEAFDPRMSKILSPDVKEYLKSPNVATAEQKNKKTGMQKYKIRQVGQKPGTSIPKMTARERSEAKTAATFSGYRQMNDPANFDRMIEEQAEYWEQVERAKEEKARASEEQEVMERVKRAQRAADHFARPKEPAGQRLSKIPKPQISHTALFLKRQIRMSRSVDSLIPQPTVLHPALRSRAPTPDSQLAAAPMAKKKPSREAKAAMNTTALKPSPSLRKTQSAGILSRKVSPKQNPGTTLTPKADEYGRLGTSKPRVLLKYAREGGVLPTISAGPPSLDSITSVGEIIGSYSKDQPFRTPPQAPGPASRDFYSNPSSFAQPVLPQSRERAPSVAVSATSTVSPATTASPSYGLPTGSSDSDLFEPDYTPTQPSSYASLYLPRLPLVPPRNPARLLTRAAPRSALPPLQTGNFQSTGPAHDSLLGQPPSANTGQDPTPTRASKGKAPVLPDADTVRARAKTLRMLSNDDGNDSDFRDDSPTLPNAFASHHECERTGPNVGGQHPLRTAPSRIQIAPQTPQPLTTPTTAVRIPSSTCAAPCSTPSSQTSARTRMQPDVSPVPAPLWTPSSSYMQPTSRSAAMSIDPGRVRPTRQTPVTPANRPPAPLYGQASTPLQATQPVISATYPSSLTGSGSRSLSERIGISPSSIIRPPMTAADHMERLRRDQERNMVNETIRLGQLLNSPSLASAASLPFAQREPSSVGGARDRRAETATSQNTSGSGNSRVRLGNLFHTDPIEQRGFIRRGRHGTPPRSRISTELEEIHSMLDHMDPTMQDYESIRSSQQSDIERDHIRHDLGLRPLRDCEPEEPRHPAHPYEWDTIKVMCRNIHNPGTVLPQPPEIPSGQPVHMSDYDDAFFTGKAYTTAPEVSPRKCRTCPAYCCHYAELLAHSEVDTNDIICASSRRKIEEAVESLRMRKPNGMEEFDTFLECSFCKSDYCPRCIVLCKEEMCQQPICRWCKEATEFCDDHNMF